MYGKLYVILVLIVAILHDFADIQLAYQDGTLYGLAVVAISIIGVIFIGNYKPKVIEDRTDLYDLARRSGY